MDDIDATAATALSTSAIQAALIVRLKAMGLLSNQDEREIYEHALHMIEAGQATSGEASHVFEAAREAIEEHLRPD